MIKLLLFVVLVILPPITVYFFSTFAGFSSVYPGVFMSLIIGLMFYLSL